VWAWAGGPSLACMGQSAEVAVLNSCPSPCPPPTTRAQSLATVKGRDAGMTDWWATQRTVSGAEVGDLKSDSAYKTALHSCRAAAAGPKSNRCV
jgi:hypothetical protein